MYETNMYEGKLAETLTILAVLDEAEAGGFVE